MLVKQLINRAYMQVGDTSHVTYTPYTLLEYYNEGNHLLHRLVASYIPKFLEIKESKEVNNTDLLELDNVIFKLNKIICDKSKINSVKVVFPRLVQIEFEKNPTVDNKFNVDVIYIPTVSYKKLDDESGYPAEIESMLVKYIVFRVLNLDVSFTSLWEEEIAKLANIYNSQDNGLENGFVAKGYWDYDSGRNDYTD
ncbi:MAG: hypothetical protein ACTTKR_01155 [Dialister pneumosintes]